MQSGEIVFFEVSQHGLLTGLYLESELEISESWAETSGVFLSEAVFFVNENDVNENGNTVFCCDCISGERLLSKENTENSRTSEVSLQSGDMVGAYSLSRRFGITVLDYIAIKKDVRKNGVGSAVLRRIKEKCRESGVGKIYLTAKARDFFLKNGGVELPSDFPLYSELLGECAECPQRGKDCFPTVMEIDV